MRSTRCAICGTGGNATELYPANLPPHAFTRQTFSARRLPDRIHCRIERCNTCSLVRSDPTAPPDPLADLYRASSFDYGGETANLRAAYGRYLRLLDNFGARKESLLQIGCGNGFFLEEALEQGYARVQGIEPSRNAIQCAGDSIKARWVKAGDVEVEG